MVHLNQLISPDKKLKYTREVEDVLLLLYYGHDSSRAPADITDIARECTERGRTRVQEIQRVVDAAAGGGEVHLVDDGVVVQPFCSRWNEWC